MRVKCSVHNHAPVEYLESRSYVRRLSESEVSIVVELSKCHVRPRDILTSLKQNNPTNVSMIKLFIMFGTSIEFLSRGKVSDATLVIYSF